MSDFTRKAAAIITNPFFTDKEMSTVLLDLIYEQHGDNTMAMFVKIQELEKKRVKEERLLLYRGLQDGIHNFVGVARKLKEEKTKRQANDYLRIMFFEDDICSMISTCKAYFPKGISRGASSNGKWYFETFLNVLRKHGEKYKEGGDSYNWVKNNDHEDYLELIFKILDDETTNTK